MKTSIVSVCTGTVLVLFANSSEAARLNGGGRGLPVNEGVEEDAGGSLLALPVERRDFETDDATSSENFNEYEWESGEGTSWSNGRSNSWDPFRSDAFLNAKSMEEKCQVMQRSLMTSDLYGRNDYDYGGDERDSSYVKKCTSASENPRGTYYSRKKTCTFTFHEVDRDEGKEDLPISDFELSTECGDSNAIPHAMFKEYASSWPDECVGDFARCYTIGRDEQIFFQFLCTKKKTIPEGATHMSVDCTEDKVSNVGYYSRRGGNDDSFMWSSVANANSMEEKCTIVQKTERYRYDYYDGYYENGKMMNSCGRIDIRDYSTVKCTSSSENARGTYCANTQACTFAFHQIGETENLAKNKLSNLCGESNVMEATTFKDYTTGSLVWPDECVGDMSRCYVIGRDESIYLNFLCGKSMSIPEGATHLSVDCTADKISAKERFEKAPVLDELV